MSLVRRPMTFTSENRDIRYDQVKNYFIGIQIFFFYKTEQFEQAFGSVGFARESLSSDWCKAGRK